MKKFMAILLIGTLILTLCCGMAGAEAAVADGTYEETV
jgi:hypothetical protein